MANCFGLKAMIWWIIVVVMTVAMLVSYICVVVWRLMWYRFDINKIRNKVKLDNAMKELKGEGFYSYDGNETFRAQYM